MSAEATIASIGLIGVFLILSAFFSSSETAFMSLQRLRILHLANIGRPGAHRMARRMEHPEKTLSTVLLGNNLVNTAAAAVATFLAIAWLDDGVGIVVATVGMTFLLLLFSEMIPKTFASRHAEWLAFRYLKPFVLVEWVLFPLSILFQIIGRAIVNLTGGKIGSRQLVTEDMLRSVISIGRQEGAVDAEEAKMLHKVLGFGDRLVKEVMIPRTEIVWMNEDTSLSDFMERYEAAPWARFPVYKEDIDNVVGILHTRDVIKAMYQKVVQPDSHLLQLVRTARFVPETKPLDDLFFEMRSSGIQMTLVVDEYGGISGMVTTQQLVEAIMGRAANEDQHQEEVEELGEGTFQVDGGMQVGEANETLGLGIPDGEFETVAGFVLDILGHIPHQGESFKHRGKRLTVSEMKGVKIEKVLVTRL